MQQLIEISLICTGIHVCFLEGMIFGRLGAKMEHWVFKPIAMCLPCMASVWSIIILQRVDIKAMLIICGINAIIAAGLQFLETIKLPENVD